MVASSTEELTCLNWAHLYNAAVNYSASSMKNAEATPPPPGLDYPPPALSLLFVDFQVRLYPKQGRVSTSPQFLASSPKPFKILEYPSKTMPQNLGCELLQCVQALRLHIHVAMKYVSHWAWNLCLRELLSVYRICSSSFAGTSQQSTFCTPLLQCTKAVVASSAMKNAVGILTH
jgi:hypothetical protein